MTKKNTSVGFYGGAGGVTGCSFLFEHGDTSILVDCGLFQGKKFTDEENYKPFPYDPNELDAVVITHGHLDHVGRLPRLVQRGFSGPVYATEPTQALAHLLFEDTLSIMESDTSSEKVLYTKDDVNKVRNQWKTLSYNEPFRINSDISIVLKDAGHILGSSMVSISVEDKVVTFTGDVGSANSPLLAKTESLEGTTHLITESVYGDKHLDSSDRRGKLEEIIEGIVNKKGTLLIPSFSIERTQTIIAEINYLITSGKIPQMPVFLDSPLAIRVTDLYKQYQGYFNVAAQNKIEEGLDLLSFPNLSFANTAKESKSIVDVSAPKIIIAGSGMSSGGRILHHEKEYLSDSSTTILFVGFQAAGTLGRRILDGVSPVEILGEKVSVKADIRTIFSYSAHKDSSELLEMISSAGHSLKQVFAVLGEPQSSMFLAQRVRDYLGIEAIVPEKGQVVYIK